MPWTPDTIRAVIAKQGFFYVGPKHRDDQANRVATRMWKKGELRRERVAYRRYHYTLPETNNAAV